MHLVTEHVTDPDEVRAAVDAAVKRFARYTARGTVVRRCPLPEGGAGDVDAHAKTFRAQVETNLFGPLNLTRAVLPVMRTRRSGVVVTISSTAGLIGQEFCTVYAASKFALEGFMESLAPEVASLRHPHDGGGARVLPHRPADPGIHQLRRVHDRRLHRAHAADRRGLERHERPPGGDPAKLAAALIDLATSDEPPLRWVAGADAVAGVEQKAKDLQAQVDAHRDLSSSLSHDTA